MNLVLNVSSEIRRYAQPRLPAYYETKSENILCYSSDKENTEEFYRLDSGHTELKNQIAPYIRCFSQHWNTFLDVNDKLVAEVYSDVYSDVYSESPDRMLAVVFTAIKREHRIDQVQIIKDDLKTLYNRFPTVIWSDYIPGRIFLDVVDEDIIVVKPNIRRCWTESEGSMDADDTIGMRFAKTLPKEWEQQLVQ
jgi:hypothetical protein